MTEHANFVQTPAEYSSPLDLARFVQAHWKDWPEPLSGLSLLPAAAVMEQFYSICYQASMLREEER